MSSPSETLPAAARVARALAAIPPGTRLLVVVGATASGKSDTALRIAETCGGEIISADSRQVYRSLDLGTGKVVGGLDPGRGSWVEVLGKTYLQAPFVSAGIDHWLIDLADPREVFTLAEYQLLAYDAMARIARRGHHPILVGGTGLYIQAVLDGLVMPNVPPDPQLRARLATMDAARLSAELHSLDPEAAGSVDTCNPRRLMRAIEIVRAAGTLAEARSRHPVPFTHRALGLALERNVLMERIAARLRTRMQAGMLDEVRGLLRDGVPVQRLIDLGLEYRFMAEYLAQAPTEAAYDEASMVSALQSAIGRFARRQGTWFRNHGPIHWFTQSADLEAAARAWLSTSGDASASAALRACPPPPGP